ncbi:HrcA family transcriptional regulator [Rubrobacter aplysinae]|uniref:HrcA family transcriptional regulator n=1 Tax=Rubrobacter aplysinae TaxID=909625 RepID=UPI000A79F482|nr:heat-inducible transcriptional repressor HrcA [Rubrobacter aplysinae]
MNLSERQREILLKTLELYISTGTPVGSAALADFVEASGSTVRAELSALESVGLLTHPHTSSGRVPTDAGYRFYVDSLMGGRSQLDALFDTPEGYGNVDELLQGVSEGMSEVSRLLAVVAGPSVLGDSVARVDYLLPRGVRTEERRELLLVVTMTSGASSTARVPVPDQVGETELRELVDALNTWIGDRSVEPGRISDGLVRDARRALSDYNPYVVGAVLEAVEVLGRATDRGVFVQGGSALLARLDDLDPSSLSAVVEIFERRRWLLHLMGDALQRSVSQDGVVVSIGAESGFDNLSGTSLVAAAYNHRERPYGVVSLIGPKRMDYDSAISTVRSAADALTYCLNSRF